MSRLKLLMEISTPENYNVTLDYHGPTGLLRSKLDSAGRSYVYSYDEFGRLTAAVTPTGKVLRLGFDLSVKGAVVKVTHDDRQPLSMLIKGYSVVTKLGTHISFNTLTDVLENHLSSKVCIRTEQLYVETLF